ncbi:hypothetical protein ACIQAC_37345 [Streptomyces sp. NPDC088387]|uniref:hypothetical protein n=1 Tax=Streptomyces sp. NPDC088387 TaxID=3365859 RepID=UPI003828FEE4
MSVEHDGYDGYDGSDGHEDDRRSDRRSDRASDGPYDAMDPLLAVLLEEPLTDEARADAAFMAGYRSAATDVELLREQLGVLAEALTAPEPEPEPVPAAETEPGPTTKPIPTPVPARRGAPRPRRRFLPIALGTLAAACAVTVLAGLGWLVVGSGGPNEAASSSDSDAGGAAEDKATAPATAAQTGPTYLACLNLVVEGDVTTVRRRPGGDQYQITLDVTRYFKPDKGDREITFLMAQDAQPPLQEGEPALVGFRADTDVPELWTVGARAIAEDRDWITNALPASRGLGCG